MISSLSNAPCCDVTAFPRILHTNFQGHRPFGSGEEDFLRFLPYKGMAGICPGPFEQTFVPLSQGGSICNLASIGPVISEEKMFENVDIQPAALQRSGKTGGR